MDHRPLAEYHGIPERLAPAASTAGAGPIPGYANVSHLAAERERSVVREVLSAVRRRLLLITGVTAIVFTAGTAAIFALPPSYKTGSTLLLEVRRVAPVKREDANAPAPTPDTVVDELQVLLSRNLLGQAAERLGLATDPDFNWTLQPGRLAAILQGVVDLASPWAPPAATSGLRDLVARMTEERAARYAGSEVDITIDSLKRALQVGAVGRSRAIEISATAREPDTAAAIANTVAELYIASQTALREAELRDVATWVTSQLHDLMSRADASARAVADYRAAQGIVRGVARGDHEADLVRQEISEVASQLTAARARRADLAAKLMQAERDMETNNLDGLADVLGSRTIQQLRAQEASTAARQADYATRFGSAHPNVVATRAELKNVRDAIGREAQRILQSRRNDLRVAQDAERDLQTRMEGLRKDVARADMIDVRLQELQREANADRALAESFLARARQISAEVSFRDASARLVSRAPVPLVPSSPNIKILLPLAFLLSLGAGGLAALLRETTSQGLRSPEELERQLGVIPIGAIPFRRSRSDRLSVGMFNEAIAGFCAHLLRRPRGRPQSVLITSALPSEGKTTTATALAAEAAGRGLRVLLVDADLRRARRIAGGPGLAEILRGSATIDAAVRREGEYWLLPCGERPANPTQLLTSDSMEHLLRQLEASYDLVIVDSAPVLVGSDVGELSRCVTETILLVRWGQTRSRSVMAAMRRLAVAGGSVSGVVMSMVDARKNAQYAHADALAPLPALRRYYGIHR